MSIKRLSIADFLALSTNTLLLDVRSPGEYNHAHIPGAISLPLFSDEERKIVGTAYKQESRAQAIKLGLDFFGPKMRQMVEEVERCQNNKAQNATSGSKTVLVYCWRGGMRSAAVAWLLDMYGFQVSALAGGYKSFRNYVLQTFQKPFQLKLLGGFTGSGKTMVLNELQKQGEIIIDLELIASHKGSAFGGLKMPAQPTQEMFENMLAKELLEKSAPAAYATLWLEDESQRIGNLNIPGPLWEKMRNSPLVFLEIPFDERLNYLVTEYGNCDTEKMIASVERISKRLGPVEAKNTIELLRAGNHKEAFRILLHYYDKRYLKGLHNRDSVSVLLTKIHCETVTPDNARAVTTSLPA